MEYCPLMPVLPLLAVDCAAGWKAWQRKSLLPTFFSAFVYEVIRILILYFLTPIFFFISISIILFGHQVFFFSPDLCIARLYLIALHVMWRVIYFIIFL
ncbi:hypothetical protein GDO81_004564 [Engystomops pustulosus]|uniref:Uncharacterized protein n=1 Tax=Engystomops pustulosus TaxID=76066 RepID=A0AAV7A2K4_ENGPU|nr:hypothetical protein GDO81_004564 [Engystomops pustulosus]